jgi:hypothetical protein
MKKLVFLLTPFLLCSCAAYDAYMMNGFDGNEYQLITQIRVDAADYATQCSNPLLAPANAVAMAKETNLFEKYSEQLPHNEDSYKASQSLNEIAQGLAKRYTEPTPVNTLFCSIKYSSIENSAKVLQHVIGNRPR